MDVLVLTTVFSWAYRWLKQTIAVQIAFGLITLLATSWVAGKLGLILTSYLLSAVSAVATIVVVVVFQNQIRRGLSRVNPIGWLNRRISAPAPEDTTAIVAKAAFALVGRRKGALLVLARRDSILDRVTAGTVIDGRMTTEVIEAIFTASSGLHDGAVVIAAGRVARAGLVLPLATETEDPSFGTRHRAAMGMAQASDSVVVCVSEEHGTVHVAVGNAINAVRNEEHLCEVLSRTRNEALLPEPDAVRASRMAKVWPHLAIFAGVLAAWAALALDRSHAVMRVVPLEIRGVSDGLAFDPPRNNSVAVELRSSRRELEVLPPDAVTAYVDLSDTAAGLHTYRVVTKAPAGIEVVSETPATVQMELRPRSPSSVPVVRGADSKGDTPNPSPTVSRR